MAGGGQVEEQEVQHWLVFVYNHTPALRGKKKKKE